MVQSLTLTFKSAHLTLTLIIQRHVLSCSTALRPAPRNMDLVTKKLQEFLHFLPQESHDNMMSELNADQSDQSDLSENDLKAFRAAWYKVCPNGSTSSHDLSPRKRELYTKERFVRACA